MTVSPKRYELSEPLSLLFLSALFARDERSSIEANACFRSKADIVALGQRRGFARGANRKKPVLSGSKGLSYSTPDVTRYVRPESGRHAVAACLYQPGARLFVTFGPHFPRVGASPG